MADTPDDKVARGKRAIEKALVVRAAGRKPSRVDGISRTEKAEMALNEAFAACFRGAQGRTVLAYLASITVNRINGPDQLDPNTLIHQEGGRYVYGVIKARTDRGRKRK